MWLNNVIFEDKQLQEERLELSDKDALYYLGPNLTLRQCTLVLKIPAKRLLIPGARLIDCTIEVKKELKNFRWHKAILKGCRITGRLSGCDFGRWRHEPEMGGIDHCDFSAAELDLCRFVDCDASTLRFPSWPCFTLLDPIRRLPELSKVAWPGRVGRTLVDLLSHSPANTAAMTLSAATFGKSLGASEAELRAALEPLDSVKF